MKKEGTRLNQYYDGADLKQGKRELYAKVRSRLLSFVCFPLYLVPLLFLCLVHVSIYTYRSPSCLHLSFYAHPSTHPPLTPRTHPLTSPRRCDYSRPACSAELTPPAAPAGLYPAWSRSPSASGWRPSTATWWCCSSARPSHLWSRRSQRPWTSHDRWMRAPAWGRYGTVG